MNVSKTRVAAATLALAGLVVGGASVAAAASSAGKCRPGRDDVCVFVHDTKAPSRLYRAQHLPGGDPGYLLATAMHRSARPRIVVHARPPYPAEERGAIYGYAPGTYQLGRVGVLYGPYPLNPNAPIAELRY